MKSFIVALFCASSLHAYGQCTDCNSFEEALKEPLKVETLKINPWQHETTLDSIPSSIGEFVNLEVLYLSDHNFANVPAAIGQLENLQELSFAGCKLETLPEEIFKLKKLKEVILLNNEFSDEYKKALKARFKTEMPKTMVLIN